MFSSLLHALTHQVKTRSHEAALVIPDGESASTLTWQQLAQRVVSQGDALDRLFAEHPDSIRSVGYASDNSLGDILTALACPLIDAIEVPVDHRLGSQAKSLADQIGGLWLESHDLTGETERDASDLDARLEAACEKIVADAFSLILWTSGTTSQPKAVTLSQRNLLGNAQAKLNAVPNSADDVRLTSLPLCHAYARTCDMGTWLLSGGTLAIGLGFDAWQTLGPQVRPTIANTVPSLAQRLFLADPEFVGIDRLRLLGCGGAAMSADDFAKWKDRGVTIIQGYGLTESSPVICSATPENATAGLVGEFVDGWEYDIRDGRLFVRGPHVMAGYWNDPTSTKQRVIDGWLDTSDLVEMDSATGQLRILGRADDVIVLDNGDKVHPQSIERQIEQIKGVRHAMILGAGRSVEAWLDADGTDALRAQIRSALADRPPWEQPAAIHFFARRLSIEAGELTAKGTIRRQQVMQFKHSQPKS